MHHTGCPGQVSEHDRIRHHSQEHVNREIQQAINDSIECHRGQSPELIGRRIEQLEKEWDIDRAVAINFGILGAAALYAGVTANRKWLYLPMIQFPFFMLHFTMGWCPPLPVFRSMRFRSRHEIEAEVSALKALRGDFEAHVPGQSVPITQRAEQPASPVQKTADGSSIAR